jgi:hypothetical protein
VPGDRLAALLEDWRAFHAHAFQLRLDALRQQRAEVAGHALHVVHAEGRGPTPLPLLLTHAWPGSSLLPYWAHRHLPGAALPDRDVSPVPTAISIFGGERVAFLKPPRELAERYYNVTSWAEHPTGGPSPPSPSLNCWPAAYATYFVMRHGA